VDPARGCDRQCSAGRVAPSVHEHSGVRDGYRGGALRIVSRSVIVPA
jgi:hypothetical protein